MKSRQEEVRGEDVGRVFFCCTAEDGTKIISFLCNLPLLLSQTMEVEVVFNDKYSKIQ